MIIAVDFDGTCVSHEYPNIGKNIGAALVLKALVENGHKLILYTMRSHKLYDGRDLLQEAVNWFSDNGIELWGINENPDQKNWTDSPKPHANLYIDDKALGVPFWGKHVDWELTAEILVDMHFITEAQYLEIESNAEWTKEVRYY